MAWYSIGDNPSSEPMLAEFTEAYMRDKGEISRNILMHPVNSLPM